MSMHELQKVQDKVKGKARRVVLAKRAKDAVLQTMQLLSSKDALMHIHCIAILNNDKTRIALFP